MGNYPVTFLIVALVACALGLGYFNGPSTALPRLAFALLLSGLAAMYLRRSRT